MSVYTLVVKFPDGKEPAIGFTTDILGGKASSISFFDYRDDHFTEEDVELITELLGEHAENNDVDVSEIINKLQFLTK